VPTLRRCEARCLPAPTSAYAKAQRDPLSQPLPVACKAQCGATLDLAKGVVGHPAQHVAVVIQRQAHAAQRVAAISGVCAIGDRGQAVEAIQVLGGGPAVDRLQHLAQRRCELLGVVCRAAVHLG
jgi:hypothetical protein